MIAGRSPLSRLRLKLRNRNRASGDRPEGAAEVVDEEETVAAMGVPRAVGIIPQTSPEVGR